MNVTICMHAHKKRNMHICICTAANARVCTVQVHALQHTVDGDGSSGPCSAAARLAAHVHVRQRLGLNFFFCNLAFFFCSKKLVYPPSRQKNNLWTLFSALYRCRGNTPRRHNPPRRALRPDGDIYGADVAKAQRREL